MFDPTMLSLSTLFLGAALLNPTERAVPMRVDWAPHDTVITMIRGGCERRCPDYRVAIFSDGTVIVQGRYYLRRPVLGTSEIPESKVEKLVEQFNAINYFNLPDHFHYKGSECTSAGNADGPNVTTTIVTGGRGKSIIHHLGCLGAIPDQLTALEHEIDVIANTAKWIRPALR